MHAPFARLTTALALVFAIATLFAAATFAQPQSNTPPSGELNLDERIAPNAYNIGGALAIGDDAGYGFASINRPVTLDTISPASPSLRQLIYRETRTSTRRSRTNAPSCEAIPTGSSRRSPTTCSFRT